MHFKSETEFNKAIKENGIKGVFLLMGSEEYLINRWKTWLTKDFEKGSFNYAIFDGDNFNVMDFYDATQQLPIFANEKSVLINGLNLKKLSSDDHDKLLEAIEELPPETMLVISAPQMDMRLSVSKKLIALVDKLGICAQFETRDAQGLVRHIRSLAKSSGCELDATVAKEIIRLVGDDMLNLTTETQKLCDYKKEGIITLEDIEKVVIAKIEERVFDLSKAIMSGNAKRALDIVANLLYLRESPIMIISTLVMGYTDLYRTETAKKEGKPLSAVAAAFATYKGKEFRVKNAFNSKISKKALSRSLKALYEADVRMKSISADQGIILEQAVVKLISARNL